MQLERRSINVIGFARVTPLLTRHQFENKPALRPGCPRSGRLACSSLVGETQLGRAARCSKTPARHRSPQPAPSTRPQGTKAGSALLVTRAGLGQMRASLGCRVGFPPNLPQNDLCFCWEKEREPALRSRAGRVGEVRRGTGRMRAQTTGFTAGARCCSASPGKARRAQPHQANRLQLRVAVYPAGSTVEGGGRTSQWGTARGPAFENDC